MRRILVITDFDTVGSGYKTICSPLFTELAKMDYDIKIIGIANRGEEHNYPFSVLPAQSIEEVKAMGSNLMQLWNPDVLVIALDIPLQVALHPYFAPAGKKYIAITPLENGPLVLDWAVEMFNMDGVFFISELGKMEAQKVGIAKAEHLVIGADTVSWRPAFPEEKKQIRAGLGIPDDAFVVLTVADNQERKNLWAGMRAIRKLKKEMPDRPIRYVLVTREQSPFGWRLRSMAVTEEVNEEVVIFERGMPQKELWGLYAISDVYLQPSKAEGLGLPVIDAMCCKIPVVATDTGAMHELLMQDRGWLIPGYTFDDEPYFTDVWGNSNRVMIDIQKTFETLKGIAMLEGRGGEWVCVENAYEYVKQRTWDRPAKQLSDKIEELCEPKLP